MSDFTKDELGKMADQCHQFYMAAMDEKNMDAISIPPEFMLALCNNFVYMYKKLYEEEEH